MHPLPCRAESLGCEGLALTVDQDSPSDRDSLGGKPMETRLKGLELIEAH
jgi:hypothetical protein